MFALHNVEARRLDRPSLPNNYSFLPKKPDQTMERPNSGLRRRSVHSNQKLPQTPTTPISTAAASAEEEEIDPLDPAPPSPLTPPHRRRRSTGFRHFEAKEKKSGFFFGGWLGREFLALFNVVNWVFKLIGTAILAVFVVALFNALPLEVRTKTARNFYDIATGWKTLLDREGWLRRAGNEWVGGMAIFERKLLECLM
ncbi:MAG: hypothetical protein LQ346_006822, partial [Caloplaca aetnensis]